MSTTTTRNQNQNEDIIDAEKNLQDKGLYDKDLNPSNTSTASDLASKESDSASNTPGNSIGGGNFNYNPVTGKTSKKVPVSASNAKGHTSGKANHRFGNTYTKLLGSKKKKAGVGGFIVAVILYFFLSIASGPAQLIQIAQLMQQFHFNASESQADVRTSRLIRFIKSGGNTQELRVGFLGKRMAVKMEARLAKAGFKYLPDGVGQFYGGFEVDPENSNFKGKSVEEIRSELAKEGLTTEVRNGRVVIPGNQRYSTNVRAVQSLLKRAGYHKVTAPIQTRAVASKWFGFGRWHPMRAADARVNQTLTQFWEAFKKKFSDRVGRGSIPITAASVGEKRPVPTCADPSACTATEQQAINDANNYNAEIDRQVAEANKAIQGLKGELDAVAGEDYREIPDKTNELADALRSKLLGRTALGAFSVTAVLCVIREMNSTYETLKEARIVLPLVRLSLEVVAAGNQVMNGKDVDLDQLGGYNQLLTDDETGSWLNSASIQAELGNTKSGETTDAEKNQKDNLDYISKDSPFTEIIDTFNTFSPIGLGKICSTAGQIVSGIITVGLSILTGGGFSVVSFLAGGILSGAASIIAMKLFVGLMTGTAVDSTAEGAVFGNNVNYGSRLASSGTNISRGGKALSAQEEEQIQAITMQTIDQDFASKSIAYRIFNPYDPKSTFAKFLAGRPTTIGENFSRLSASFFNIGKMFASIPSFATATTGAQTFGTYDYGFPEYGFSAADMDNDAVYDPYENARAVLPLLTSRTDLVDRAEKCFGATIAKDSNGAWGVTHNGEYPNPYNVTDNDWSDAAKWNCNDSSTEWLRFRFFIFDTTMMDAISCFEEDDTESCNNVGFTPPAAAGGAGGPIDCNATPGDMGIGDLSGNAGNYRATIEQYAPTRSCPGTPTPPGAVPSDPNKQYFANCSDNCALRNVQGQADIQACGGGTYYGPGNYIRVKYRNPPLGGNTICIPTFTPSGTPPGGGGQGAGVCTEFPNGWRWVGGPNAGQTCP